MKGVKFCISDLSIREKNRFFNEIQYSDLAVGHSPSFKANEFCSTVIYPLTIIESTIVSKDDSAKYTVGKGKIKVLHEYHNLLIKTSAIQLAM